MSSSFRSTLIPSINGGCHASNLLQLPNGEILCAWFGKAEGGLENIGIWLSRLRHGSSWTHPRQIALFEGQNCQNPVLFTAPETGKLWLFHTTQVVGKQEEAVIIARISDDSGHSWSEPYYPFGDRRGSLTRQPACVLGDGGWALPVFNCRAEGEGWKGNNDSSSILHTCDGGKTWAAKDIPDGVGAVHMNIVPRSDTSSHWVAFFRSRWADNIYRATSIDGLDWSKPQPPSLPNPNCGIAASRLPNGKLITVFNLARSNSALASADTPKEAIWGLPRKALTVALSDDDGFTWRHRLLEDFEAETLASDPLMKGVAGELSYPSVIVDQGRVTHIAYTFHRKNIKHVEIKDIERWIEVGQPN